MVSKCRVRVVALRHQDVRGPPPGPLGHSPGHRGEELEPLGRRSAMQRCGRSHKVVPQGVHVSPLTTIRVVVVVVYAFRPCRLVLYCPCRRPSFFTTHNNYNDYYFISMQMI